MFLQFHTHLWSGHDFTISVKYYTVEKKIQNHKKVLILWLTLTLTYIFIFQGHKIIYISLAYQVLHEMTQKLYKSVNYVQR